MLIKKSMKNEIIALPVFQERLSPLLDEARKFVIITLRGEVIAERTLIEINEQSAFIRIERLKEMGVIVILCGAVSDVVAKFIIEREFQLYSWLTGTTDEVVDQYIKGTLPQNCMRYLNKSGMRMCKRHRRGWKFHQRGGSYENSTTGTQE